MIFKRNISIRTLLVFVTIVGVILALNRLVETKTSRFLNVLKEGKLEMEVELDGKNYKIPDASLFDATEKTNWYDILMFMRKHELRYSGNFVAGGYVTVTRYQYYVVDLFGPPREKKSFDLMMIN